MQPLTRVTGVAVPLDIANVDTDQIIPARFLRKPRSAGYDHFLFHDLRRETPDFPLVQPAWRDAPILVTGPNFGCGSSREGAVYALVDAGIRVVVAPSFGDIFSSNAAKNGLLTLVLPEPTVASLRRFLAATPGAEITVDLPNQTVRLPDGNRHSFDIDPFRKDCLIQGLDDVELTLRHRDALEAFERRHLAEPGLMPVGAPSE